MSVVKSSFKSIINIIDKPYYFFASFASILGLIFTFVFDECAVIIALSVFCLMLIVFAIYIVYFLHRLFDFEGDQDRSRSTFVKYETGDSNHITFESYKLIQCKRPILTEKEWVFKWTGSKFPKIESNTQEVLDVFDLENPNQYDKAILKFKKPLRYNETAVVHFKAELDDTDHASKTQVESKVLTEVDIIHYRIILKYKGPNCTERAFLERRKINTQFGTDYEEIRQIPFDNDTKSFEHHLINPEVGYFYRIRWDR